MRSLTRVCCWLMLLRVIVLGTVTCTWTPQNLSLHVSRQFVKYSEVFFNWDYGGALVFDGIYQASRQFDLNLTSTLDGYLDKFLEQPNQYGYKLLHNQHIDWGHAVGDTVGLFPIAYLNRLISQTGRPGYNASRDLAVIRKVADNYILGWPYRLPDGTFARTKGWVGERGKNASFLWADDQYMGLTLLSRLAIYLDKSDYAEFVAKQALAFRDGLEDQADNLYRHGYNQAENHQSCCKWGRGNGWSLLSHVEVLQALNNFPQLKNSSMHDHLVYMLQMHALAVLRTQTSAGGWHQLLNESSTFLETSCTAMFLQSFIRGVQQGWMMPRTFQTSIERAWKALQETVQQDGTITGVCCGTGILTSVAEYNARPTWYLLSSAGGVGSVLSAAVAYQQYKEQQQQYPKQH